MEKAEPDIENCQRIESIDDEIPNEYDPFKCEECVTWDCVYMPDKVAERAAEKFMEGELESMFPDGIDDGFNFSDFGES